MTTTTKNKSAKPLVLYFQAHQPLRLRRLGFLDIGDDINYFDEGSNTHILRRTVQNCYIPVNEILTELINGHDNVKVTFCLSGPLIRQLEKFAPEGLASFKELVARGSVVLLAETSHHSLASLLPNDEFT